MKIEDDSYIGDECQINELPSFNLPKNMVVSGTGKKNHRFSRVHGGNTAFTYHQRSKIVNQCYSASPTKYSGNLNQKYALLKTYAEITTPSKIKVKTQISPECGPSFKKKKASVFKPVNLQPNNSDVWIETETNSDCQTEDWECNEQATPFFNKYKELTFGNKRQEPLNSKHPTFRFEQMGKIRNNIKKLKKLNIVFNMSSSKSCERPDKKLSSNEIFNRIFNIK